MIESWVPILTALVAIVGGAIAYRIQRRIDRLETLNERRRVVYQRFLERLFDHVEQRTEETRSAYDYCKCELVLVASDEVLHSLGAVQEAAVMDMNAVGPEDAHSAVSDLIRKMRIDSFAKTDIEGWAFEYLVPIGKPTPLTSKQEAQP